MLEAVSKKLKLRSAWQLYVMILLPVVVLLVFNYWPMLGFSIAFQNFMPTKGFFGSPFVGLENFQKVLSYHDFAMVLRNTVSISVIKLITRLAFSTVIALALHEIRSERYKKLYQNVALFPYFLSWVVLGNIFLDVFSQTGAAGAFARVLGVECPYFLGDPQLFRSIVVLTSNWKGYGYELVVIIAALASIDITYYEAADIDGATHWQKMIYLTIPCILPTIMMLLIMSLGEVLNAGFEQIMVMYNPLVYESADILDTYVYRLSFESAQYSLATAVGLFKSVVGFVLVMTANYVAGRYANYQVL